MSVHAHQWNLFTQAHNCKALTGDIFFGYANIFVGIQHIFMTVMATQRAQTQLVSLRVYATKALGEEGKFAVVKYN